MKRYNVPISNTLLENKHFQNMGLAIWLFIWFIDKMTKIDNDGNGRVLGGKPITYEEIKDHFDISRRTYNRWVDALRDNGYISTTRTPHGLQIVVHKAKKGYIKNEQSDVPNMYSDVPKSVKRYAKSGTSNIRLYKDYTKTENNKGIKSPNKEKVRKMLLNKGLL